MERPDEEKNRPTLWGKLRSIPKKDKDLCIKLGICLLAGVLLMLLGTAGHRQEKPDAPASAEIGESNCHNEEAILEEKLVNILSQVEGAGRVSVAVTLAEGAEAVYATDNDSREATEQQERSSSLTEINDAPVLVKELFPKVQGAVVVAEGAGDPLVKERLCEAATSLLGIRSSQVAIIEKASQR